MRGKLSCGHAPSVVGQVTSGPTGIARTPDGQEICYACAAKLQREQMARDGSTVGYLVGDAIQTWSGEPLASVTSRVARRNGFHGSTIVYFRAIDPTGRRWHGTSPGDHMYARMRACK